MTREQLKAGRKQVGLTQAQAAARMGLSQAYLSLLEGGARKVTAAVARSAARLYRLEPSMTPPPLPPARARSSKTLPHQLAALGYPGFGHLRKSTPVNPALVVLEAVSENELDGRVAEAVPWVLGRYPDLDWKGLVTYAKVRDVQNRLGFFVTLARELSQTRSSSAASATLRRVETELEASRLAAETTLGRESMPEAERAWLREHRSAEARHWNVLAGMKARDLPYARAS